MQKLSQAIRARRLALGMSQQELASRVGYRSKSSVNKIELGERGLRPEQLETFALALSTTPAALMGYAEPVSAGEAEFLRLARLLTPENRRALLVQLEALVKKQSPGGGSKG
jgi:transcriptional regulator with XRE-family HTH domain